MKEKSVKMYLKEYTSKLEFWNNKKMISVHNKIKNQKLKKIYNKILSLYINVNFILNVWKSSVKVEKNKNNTIVCTIIIKNNINNNWERYLYKRCIDNIKNVIDTYNIKYMIISKKLNKLEEIKNIYKDKHIIVCNGKYLEKIMLIEMLKYISNIQKEKMENQVVHVLVNDNNCVNICLIEYLSKKIKCLNIVTHNIKKFQIVESFLYEKEDIMIVISNNKRKSINKAKIIVNLDFDNDEFSKYQLNRDAIIINISNNNLDIEKSFNGIFINSLKMCKLKNNYIKNSNLFKLEELYESFIIGEQDFYKAIKKIKEDNVEIQELIGKRGKIQQLEYTKSA